jgi:rhamnopyranosyl-N-acetylglucosaminyl-diphospho-decaprenol beta-1,3/1,4-galactofuranosyltransferase
MNIAAVVVTFNRLSFLKRNLYLLLTQSRVPDQIIVVNNASSDGTGKFLDNFKQTHPVITVLHLKENLGGSGGFAVGLDYAVKHSADWVWMMDDDAFPYKDALMNLSAEIKKAPPYVGVLWSRITDKSDAKPLNTVIPVISGTFVGFAVRKEAVKKVGLPDASFFIYADDYDYSVRIRKAGFSIYRVNSSLILHKDWAQRKHVFKFPFMKPYVPAWKTYYLIRNSLNATRHIKLFHIALRVYFYFDRFVWSYVNPDTKRYVFKGFRDGVKGVKGKTVLPSSS